MSGPAFFFAVGRPVTVLALFGLLLNIHATVRASRRERSAAEALLAAPKVGGAE